MVPQKAWSRGVPVGGRVGDCIPLFMLSICKGGNLFLYEPGLKLDKKSIKNGLEGQKC